jgi:hypothetical protein
METFQFANFMGPETDQKKLWGLLIRKERWGLSWLGLCLCFVLACSTAWFLLLNLQPFLAETRRVNTDTLVVEGWIHEYAIRDAVEEFRRGHYRRVFTTGGPIIGNGGYINDYQTSASVGAGLLKRYGLSDDEVQVVPSHVIDRDRTFASAVALLQWFGEHNVEVQGLNVVTESAHARRTRLTFADAFGKDVAVGVIAVANPDYNERHWWRYSEGVKEFGSETLAYVYTMLFFHRSESSPALNSTTPVAQARR